MVVVEGRYRRVKREALCENDGRATARTRSLSICSDEDGDLHLPRRKQETVRMRWLIETHASSHWTAAGVQLWRGALLLSEFVLTSGLRAVENKIVLEVGCGVGLVAIAAAENAGRVIATDMNIDALEVAKRNVGRNSRANIELRRWDWTEPICSESMAQEKTARMFMWKAEDHQLVQSVQVVLASDVFYDDELTLTFLQALTVLMRTNPSIPQWRSVLFSPRTHLLPFLLDMISFEWHSATVLDYLRRLPRHQDYMEAGSPFNPSHISYNIDVKTI